MEHYQIRQTYKLIHDVYQLANGRVLHGWIRGPVHGEIAHGEYFVYESLIDGTHRGGRCRVQTQLLQRHSNRETSLKFREQPQVTPNIKAAYRGVGDVVLVAQVHIAHGDLHAIDHFGQQAQQNAVTALPLLRGLGLQLGGFEHLRAHESRLLGEQLTLLPLFRALLRRRGESRDSADLRALLLTLSATTAGLASR
jgi:hypothetical protein